MISRHLSPDRQRLNLALTNNELYRMINPDLIKDNLRAFMWEDPWTSPSALMYAIETDKTELIERILDSVDFEDCGGLQAQAQLLQERTTRRWNALDDFVEYALVFCFYLKSYRCLRVLVRRLPAARQALAANRERWLAHVDGSVDIIGCFSEI